MKTLSQKLAELGRAQENIAREAWPNGATLTCHLCQRTEQATSAECGQYLRNGWPKCCGTMMRLSR